MKIIHCTHRSNNINLFSYKCDLTKTNLRSPKQIDKFDFKDFCNIENIEYDDFLIYANCYDKLMNKERFNLNFQNLDHKEIFNSYTIFNHEIGRRINEIANDDDLVVVEDSCLFLLPEIVNCRVAFRNLKFDHFFIENVPFYMRLLENLIKAQKFFADVNSLNSFIHYFNCSFELQNYKLGGYWFMKKYVDKGFLINILDHFKTAINKNSQLDEITNLEDGIKNLELSSGKYDNGILNKISSLIIPKQNLVVLACNDAMHLETFLKDNPDVKVRYLLNMKNYSQYDMDLIYNLHSKFKLNFEIVEIQNYSDVLVEVIYSDLFVGGFFEELARYFGKITIKDSFDQKLLSENIKAGIAKKKCKTEYVIGRDEYINEFMKINGYDIKKEINENEDHIIECHMKDVNRAMGVDCSEASTITESTTTQNTAEENTTTQINNRSADTFSTSNIDPLIPLFIKVNQEDDDMSYYVRKCDFDGEITDDMLYSNCKNLEISHGSNSYADLLSEKKMKNTTKIQLSDIKSYWDKSKKVVLADYDGTLVPITSDPEKTKPSERLNNIFTKFINSKDSTLILCTGRPVEDCDNWFPNEIEVYGEHGAQHRKDSVWSESNRCEYLNECKEVMQYYSDRTPLTTIEEKETGLTFHYNNVQSFDPTAMFKQLRRIAGDYVIYGKLIIEVVSSSKDKICKKVNPDLVLGDDLADEEMFKCNKGMSVRIGEGLSYAENHIETYESALELLESLFE